MLGVFSYKGRITGRAIFPKCIDFVAVREIKAKIQNIKQITLVKLSVVMRIQVPSFLVRGLEVSHFLLRPESIPLVGCMLYIVARISMSIRKP